MWSIGIWMMLTIVAPFSPEWLANPLVEKHLPDLLQGRFRPTIGSLYWGIDGPAGLLLAFGPTALCYGLAWKYARQIDPAVACSTSPQD